MSGVHDLDDVKLNLNDPVTLTKDATISTQSNSSQGRNRIHSNKINTKLEYHLAIAKTVKGASAVKLIGDALASNGLYAFGELLCFPGISELATHPTHSSYHRLLEIFAFGTWQDYRENATNLPELNSAQATKLKQLSIISRASQSKVIPYADLLETLEIQTVQELEELIIDAIYSNILEAKLDQKFSQVEMESCIGRDVRLVTSSETNGREIEMDGSLDSDPPVGSVLELRSRLQMWTDSVGGVLNQLDQYIDSIREKDTKTADFEAQQAESVRKVLQSLPTQHPKDRKGKQREPHLSQSRTDEQMALDDSDLTARSVASAL
ncbi:hypothetical protein DFH28DRAFT_953373 [Melampsora americana]|nr:hypothetical protein DFH28DRAFT_953373 [Melampsora americana]